MAPLLDRRLRRALVERIEYYRELGIYDFYSATPTWPRRLS